MSVHPFPRKGEKREPSSLVPTLNEDIIKRVEERFEAASPGDKATVWKLRKRLPSERRDLITLARNLDAMLGKLRRGGKVEALAAAGFSGDEQSGYRGNLTIPETVDQVDGDRLRRLTPRVDRYLNVALAIAGDRRIAIERLFRGTSFDVQHANEDRDWADRLSRALEVMAGRVDARSGLSKLFDQLSSDNVCLTGAAGLDLRITNWLSETFHKFDFATGGAVDGSWRYDRSEDGTPRCGAPLFCPKIALARRSHDWSSKVFALVERDGTKLDHPGQITIRAASTTYLALVPIASSLTVPSTIAAWLMERPTASIQGRTGDTIWRICPEGRGYTMWTDSGVWSLGADSIESSDWQAHLFLDQSAAAYENPDLGSGSWWCMPATAGNMRKHLSAEPQEMLLRSPRPKINLSRVARDVDEWEELDRNLVDPAIYAPLGSTAAKIQEGLATGALADQMTEEVETLAAARQTLKRRLRSGCDIANLMLAP
ncbi:hypothetical protein M0208_03705 [Sphingomonas sp. SUN019]|uniref:hypothetical protein n=1 Tax=Sphingomonas sp. SUN019 TaxID=2937788 RepID=UPI002164EF25|nr:hypothetical protein [Sphingomonas sp. SUN019]UVO49657.1 hypothetical protein M0208_03705 [Sphingomonas sp. SUN019]